MELIGPLQARVMHIIWNRGSVTVHQMRDELLADPEAKRLAYTTVLTVMRNLVKRGLLAQQPEGRHHRFTALVEEARYKCDLLQHLRHEMFNGDLRRMLAAVADDDSLPEPERARIRGLLVAGG